MTGSHNVATGGAALGANTTGNGNTATGYIALSTNTTGNNNTAIGEAALGNNTTGNFNIALGDGAARISPRAIAISISVTLVSLVRPVESASARKEPRQERLSPELVRQGLAAQRLR